MSDGRKDVNETNRVTDWEVVSLTASAYSASPGPQGFDPSEQHKDEEFNKTEQGSVNKTEQGSVNKTEQGSVNKTEQESFNKTEQESSDKMIMSKHFAIPPHEPENLPAELFCGEIHKEQGIHHEDFTEPHRFTKDKCTVHLDNDLHGSQLYDMGHSLSDHSMDFGDDKGEEDQEKLEKEQTFYVSANYGSFHDEADMSQSLIHDEVSNLVESKHPSQDNVDYPPGPAEGCKPEEENNQGRSDESYEAWWKKRAMYVYNNAKGTNAFLSIFVAVAVAGLVILGQRWRREKSQFHQFKWKFGVTDEKINKVAGPVSRFNVLVGGHRRGVSMREELH